jgi:hypothetical protein
MNADAGIVAVIRTVLGREGVVVPFRDVRA